MPFRVSARASRAARLTIFHIKKSPLHLGGKHCRKNRFTKFGHAAYNFRADPSGRISDPGKRFFISKRHDVQMV
jgi:hypothetical protein